MGQSTLTGFLSESHGGIYSRKLQPSRQSGKYHYRLMPYGLPRVPSVFQCFRNYILHDCLGKFMIIYNDDILIYSSDCKNHFTQVLRLLRQHLSSMSKVRNVNFMSPKSNLSRRYRQWGTGQKPKTVWELQRFQGFAICNSFAKYISSTTQIRYKTQTVSHSILFMQAFTCRIKLQCRQQGTVKSGNKSVDCLFLLNLILPCPNIQALRIPRQSRQMPYQWWIRKRKTMTN